MIDDERHWINVIDSVTIFAIIKQFYQMSKTDENILIEKINIKFILYFCIALR